MQFITLPGYQPSRPLDFSPITDSIDRGNRNALARAAQDLQQRQFGLQQQQFDLTKRDSDRQHTNALAREEAFRAFLADPSAIKDPATLAAIRLGGADQAGSMIMQGRNADLQRAQMDTQRRLAEAQIAAQNANLQQVRMQTPEWRQANAARFGIDVNTPHGKAWVVSGTYSPPGPMDEFMRGLAGQVQGQSQGAVPSAPPPAGAGAPRVQPQSNDAPPADPMFIPTQAAAPGAAPQAPAMVNTPMGPMTEQQARILGFGLAMSGKGDAGKMINEAVDRDKLGKEAANANDKSQLENLQALQNVRLIRSSYSPDFLNLGTRFRMGWNELAGKLGTLKPEEQAKLYEFATFRADAARYINVAIKNASGATVTEQELRRNLAELPNAGSGLFDGDSPTSFKAKLDRAEDMLMLGLARANFLRARGFRGNVDEAARQVPIDAMRGIIKQRAGEIGAEIRAANPNISPTELRFQTEQRVRQEMGI